MMNQQEQISKAKSGKELVNLAKKYNVRCSSGCGRIANRVYTDVQRNFDHLITLTCGKCYVTRCVVPQTFETCIEQYGVIASKSIEVNLEWWTQFNISPAKDDHFQRIEFDDIESVIEKELNFN